MQNRCFPVVVASTHRSDIEHVYSDGLLYWFELREEAGVTPLQQGKRSVKGVWQGQRAGVIFDAERMWA